MEALIAGLIGMIFLVLAVVYDAFNGGDEERD